MGTRHVFIVYRHVDVGCSSSALFSLCSTSLSEIECVSCPFAVPRKSDSACAHRQIAIEVTDILVSRRIHFVQQVVGNR